MKIVKKWRTRLFAIAAAALLAVACLPTAAFAQGGKPEYPDVEKTVNGVKATDAAAGETVNFTLTSSVPIDLWKCFDFRGETTTPAAGGNLGSVIDGAQYTFTFHDDMDPKLISNNDLKVKIGDTTLSTDQYEYTETTGDDCSFHVTLDLVSLYASGVIKDADYAAPAAIEVSYSAKLSENATAGTYKNVSKVTWEKKIVDREDPDDPVPDDPDPKDPEDPDDPGGSEEDEVDVYTYKINLLKLDKDNSTTKLTGAVFKLEMLTDEAANTWTVVGTNQTTDAEGAASWDGLKEGTYRLTEVDAPAGYVKDTRPVTVKIPDSASAETKTASLQFTNGKAPSTGGSGVMMYTIAGLIILGGAAVAFTVSRKKSRG